MQAICIGGPLDAKRPPWSNNAARAHHDGCTYHYQTLGGIPVWVAHDPMPAPELIKLLLGMYRAGIDEEDEDEDEAGGHA